MGPGIPYNNNFFRYKDISMNNFSKLRKKKNFIHFKSKKKILVFLEETEKME